MLTGKFHDANKPVKDKDGNPLTTSEEQLSIRPAPEAPPDIPPAETELPINCDKPSKSEIRKAITILKNEKTAGPDNIQTEATKTDTDTTVINLHGLFSKVWEKEEVAAKWKGDLLSSYQRKETSWTVATTEDSWSCQFISHWRE